MSEALTQDLFNTDPQRYKQLYEERLQRRKARRKAYLASPQGKARCKAAKKAWEAKNPDKITAHNEYLKALHKQQRELYNQLVAADSTGVQ